MFDIYRIADIPLRIKRVQWLHSHTQDIITCPHCNWQGKMTEEMRKDAVNGQIPSCPQRQCAEAIYFYPKELMFR